MTDVRPKVVAFAKDYNVCNHIRIRMVAKQIKKAELCDLSLIDGDTKIDDISYIMKSGIHKCDIIWMGRVVNVSLIKTCIELQRLGKKIVLDLDDDIFNVSPLSSHYEEWGTTEVTMADGVKLWRDGIDGFRINDNKDRLEMFRELIKLVDCLTVTTPRLADCYRPFAKMVAVVPNSLDMSKWAGGSACLTKKNPDDIRILWMGGSSHYEDMWEIEKVIPRISEKYSKVKWVVAGQYFEYFWRNIPPERVEVVPWAHIEAYPFASRLLVPDIGVCPLRVTDFNGGKSSIKYYEYSALGIPTVASATPPYMDDIKHGETGLLAHDTSSWVNRLSLLIEDPLERARIGGNASRYVYDNYSLVNVAKIQTEVFKSLVKQEV